MDYSKFNDDDFDAKDWINHAFRAHKEGTLEQHATTLVMKLQMFMQEVNNVVDDSCQQVVNNLPRVSKELESVRQEACMLQEQMKMVKYDIQKVEQNTASSMQTLLTLDNVKSHMEQAADALKEADNWTSLAADVDDVFESQNIDEIAKKIIGMQQSLYILTDVADYNERCQFLELLKNRLEATSSTAVISAFNSMDIKAAKKYCQMFSDIGRCEHLKKYYHRCYKGKVLDCWKEINEGEKEEEEEEEDDGTSLKKFQKLLNAFYDRLVVIIQSQLKWCEQIFTSPLATVLEMVADALKSLVPSPAQIIQQYIMTSSSSSPSSSSSSSSVVESLIAVKEVTDNFVSFLEKSFTDHHLDACDEASIISFLTSLYSPLTPATQQLHKLQQLSLAAHLDSVMLDHPDIMESTLLLQQSINKIFSVALLWGKHCMHLNGGTSYLRHLSNTREYLLDYLKQVNRVLSNIFEKCKPNPTSDSINSNTLDADEWIHFQNSLKLILFTGELVTKTEDLTRAMTSQVLSVCKEDVEAGSANRRLLRDPRMHLIGSTEDKKALDRLISTVQEDGGKTLLSDVMAELSTTCVNVHHRAFDIVFNPLKFHLDSLLSLPVWTSDSVGSSLTSDLPDFSFIPQEYITNVGEYLMTIPQQLEAFSNDQAMTKALVYASLPYLPPIAPDDRGHLADIWLRSLTTGASRYFIDNIMKIKKLTQPSTKQLTVDINYLMNVLEDLALTACEELQDIKQLLTTPQEKYNELQDTVSPKFFVNVANMRGLRLTN